MANKSKTKIYFWLKLDENFFKNIIIKKARKAGGDTMVIIYQRLMLESLSTDGILYYEGALDNLSEELSLSLDEDVEKIQMTLAFFTKYGLIQIDDNQNADMLQVHALVEQETNWARYKREDRKKKETKKLEDVQPASNECPTEKELEKELEKDTEKEIDLDLEKDKEKEDSYLPQNQVQNLADFIQNEFGTITPGQTEELRKLLFEDKFNIDVIKLAVTEASLSNKRSINYVKGILRNWKAEGIETVKAAEQRKSEKFAQPKAPNMDFTIPMDGPWNGK